MNEIIKLLKENRKNFEKAFDNVGKDLMIIKHSGKLNMGEIKTINDFFFFIGSLKEKYVKK